MAVPAAKPKDLVRVLLRLGFVEREGKGSHRFFRHPTTGAVTVVPFHTKELSPVFVKAIIKQSGVEESRFLELL
jgi:predicted RNA binding protein YcfA (HicA-like mRNA interferase family)